MSNFHTDHEREVRCARTNADALKHLLQAASALADLSVEAVDRQDADLGKAVTTIQHSVIYAVSAMHGHPYQKP